MELPTKSEMIDRSSRHRAYRNDSDVVNLLWKGYLTGLHEWGFLSDDDYREVVSQLKDIGDDELRGPLFPKDAFERDDLPTIREIERIVDDSLVTHQHNEQIHLLWHGYLAALQEWARFLGGDNYHFLREKLGDIGDDELQEIFLGIPNTDEPVREDENG